MLEPVLARSTSEVERDRARRLLDASAESGTGSNTPIFRRVEPGEQRVYGIFEGVQCTGADAVLLVRTDSGVLRARTQNLSDVHFISYRPAAPSLVGCGEMPRPVEVYLTWKVGPDAGTRAKGPRWRLNSCRKDSCRKPDTSRPRLTDRRCFPGLFHVRFEKAKHEQIAHTTSVLS